MNSAGEVEVINIDDLERVDPVAESDSEDATEQTFVYVGARTPGGNIEQPENFDPAELAVMHDLPVSKRVQLLKTFFDVEEDPHTRKAFKRTKKGSAARYDDFFDCSAVVGFAQSLLDNRKASVEDLRTAAAVLLRFTTLMRSSDLAHVLPQLRGLG